DHHPDRARPRRRPRPRRAAARLLPARVRPHRGRLGPHRLRRHPRHLHGVRRGVRPALDGRPRHGLGHGGVRDASRVHRRAQAPGRLQGAPRRAQRRDPAAHRPVHPRGDRLRGARRAHDLPGLRRADRGRRHALRVHHGRLRRARTRHGRPAGAGAAVALAAHGLRGGRLVRDRRRRRAARPGLSRGLHGGGRRQRRHDGRRGPRGGPGHRGAHAAVPRPPRRPARARRARDRRAPRGPGRRPGRRGL
ncbi:MAG: Ribonuclease PH, partial [uncultured Solirubrobacteraceae bacterium]